MSGHVYTDGNLLLTCMQGGKHARQKMKVEFCLKSNVIRLQVEQSMLQMLDLPSKPLPECAARVLLMNKPQCKYKFEMEQGGALGTTTTDSEMTHPYVLIWISYCTQWLSPV